MRFRYDTTLEHPVYPAGDVPDQSAAWLTILLAKSLDQWFSLPHRTLYQPGDRQVQIGFQSISFPVCDYAETFAPLTAAIHKVWPIQCFGISRNGEMVGLSLSENERGYFIQQQSTSGVWHTELHGLYLNLQLPDETAARCMAQLMRVLSFRRPSVALDWEYADFLRQQNLSGTDPTHTFCYVILSEEDPTPELRLSGLTQGQKQILWRLFLEKQVYPPEFEWLWSSLAQGFPPEWLEWSMALYQVLEQLQYRYVCRGRQFEMLDAQGKRVYFSVDRGGAAQRVLMKVLYPLND